jgi:hypothetical protein
MRNNPIPRPVKAEKSRRREDFASPREKRRAIHHRNDHFSTSPNAVGLNHQPFNTLATFPPFEVQVKSRVILYYLPDARTTAREACGLRLRTISGNYFRAYCRA